MYLLVNLLIKLSMLHCA